MTFPSRRTPAKSPAVEASSSQDTQDTQDTEQTGDELENYSKNVQKRIKKLTEKYRKEERDREEAVRFAQQLRDENEKLKGRLQNLDTGYLNEYGHTSTVAGSHRKASIS